MSTEPVALVAQALKNPAPESEAVCMIQDPSGFLFSQAGQGRVKKKRVNGLRGRLTLIGAWGGVDVCQRQRRNELPPDLLFLKDPGDKRSEDTLVHPQQQVANFRRLSRVCL